MDQRSTIYRLMKTFLSLMPLSIMMTPSLTNPPEPLIFVPFSSLSTSKANGTRPSEKLQPLILPLTVCKNSNHPSWILIDGLLLIRGEDDSRDCSYVPYEAAHEGDNIKSEILRITHEQMAHMGAQKCFKYASRHFYWMTMRTDFED